MTGPQGNSNAPGPKRRKIHKLGGENRKPWEDSDCKSCVRGTERSHPSQRERKDLGRLEKASERKKKIPPAEQRVYAPGRMRKRGRPEIKGKKGKFAPGGGRNSGKLRGRPRRVVAPLRMTSRHQEKGRPSGIQEEENLASGRKTRKLDPGGRPSRSPVCQKRWPVPRSLRKPFLRPGKKKKRKPDRKTEEATQHNGGTFPANT